MKEFFGGISNGKDNGQDCGTGEKPWIYLSGIRDLWRTCQHMGLRKSGRRVEEQCKESMVAEVYSGE